MYLVKMNLPQSHHQPQALWRVFWPVVRDFYGTVQELCSTFSHIKSNIVLWVCLWTCEFVFRQMLQANKQTKINGKTNFVLGKVWFGLVWFDLVKSCLVWFTFSWFGLIKFSSVNFVLFGSVRIFMNKKIQKKSKKTKMDWNIELLRN